LAADLRRSIDSRALTAVASNATRLQGAANVVRTHAATLNAAVTQMTTMYNALVAKLQAPVHNALGVPAALGRIRADLKAVPGLQKSSPAYLKLVADINGAQTLAQTVSDSLNRLKTHAQSLAIEVHTLHSDLTTMQRTITGLVAASVTNAKNTTHTTLRNAVNRLDTRFAAAAATANGALAGAGENARRRVAGAQQTAGRTVADAKQAAHQEITAARQRAKQAIASALANGKAAIASAERKVNQVLASVKAKAHADLVSAKQKAKQGGQAALKSAQASAAQAQAKAQKAVATANGDYAALLAINQQALVNELPGGDATGATEQDGSLIYTIKGS
jgi:hypothetical protein